MKFYFDKCRNLLLKSNFFNLNYYKTSVRWHKYYDLYLITCLICLIFSNTLSNNIIFLYSLLRNITNINNKYLLKFCSFFLGGTVVCLLFFAQFYEFTKLVNSFIFLPILFCLIYIILVLLLSIKFLFRRYLIGSQTTHKCGPLNLLWLFRQITLNFFHLIHSIFFFPYLFWNLTVNSVCYMYLFIFKGGSISEITADSFIQKKIKRLTFFKTIKPIVISSVLTFSGRLLNFIRSWAVFPINFLSATINNLLRNFKTLSSGFLIFNFMFTYFFFYILGFLCNYTALFVLVSRSPRLALSLLKQTFVFGVASLFFYQNPTNHSRFYPKLTINHFCCSRNYYTLLDYYLLKDFVIALWFTFSAKLDVRFRLLQLGTAYSFSSVFATYCINKHLCSRVPYRFYLVRRLLAATFYFVMSLILTFGFVTIIFLFYPYLFIITDFYASVPKLLVWLIASLELIFLKVFSFWGAYATTPPLFFDWFELASLTASDDPGEEDRLKNIFRRAKFFFNFSSIRPFSFSTLVFLASFIEAISAFYLGLSSHSNTSVLLNSVLIFQSVSLSDFSPIFQHGIFYGFDNFTYFLRNTCFDVHLDYAFCDIYGTLEYIIFIERELLNYFYLLAGFNFFSGSAPELLICAFFSLLFEVLYASLVNFYFFLLDLEIFFAFIAKRQYAVEFYLFCYVVSFLDFFTFKYMVFDFFNVVFIQFSLLFELAFVVWNPLCLVQLPNFLFIQFIIAILSFWCSLLIYPLLFCAIFECILDGWVLSILAAVDGSWLFNLDLFYIYCIFHKLSSIFFLIINPLSPVYVLFDILNIFNFFFFWLQATWLLFPQLVAASVFGIFLDVTFFFFQKCKEFYLIPLFTYYNPLILFSQYLSVSVEFLLTYLHVLFSFLGVAIYFNYCWCIEVILTSSRWSSYSVLMNELGTFLHYSGLCGFFTDIGLYFVIGYLGISLVVVLGKLSISSFSNPGMRDWSYTIHSLFLSKNASLPSTSFIGIFDIKLTSNDHLFFRVDRSSIASYQSNSNFMLHPVSKLYLKSYDFHSDYWTLTNSSGFFTDPSGLDSSATTTGVLSPFTFSSSSLPIFRKRSSHFYLRTLRDILQNTRLLFLEVAFCLLSYLNILGGPITERKRESFLVIITYFSLITRTSFVTHLLEIFFSLLGAFCLTVYYLFFAPFVLLTFPFRRTINKFYLSEKKTQLNVLLKSSFVTNFTFPFEASSTLRAYFLDKVFVVGTARGLLLNLPYLLLFPIFGVSNLLGAFYWHNYSESSIDLQLRRLMTLSDIHNQDNKYGNSRNGFNTKFLNELQLENMQLNSSSFNFRDLTKLYFKRRGWAEDYLIKHYQHLSMGRFALAEAKLLSTSFLDRYLYNFVWEDLVKPDDFFVRHLSSGTLTKIEVFEKNSAGTNFLNSPYKVFFYLTYSARSKELTSIFAGYLMLRDMSMDAEQAIYNKAALPNQVTNLSESSSNWIAKLARYFFFFNQISLNTYFEFVVRSYKRFFRWYYLWEKGYTKWYPSSSIKYLTFTSQSRGYNLFYSFEKLTSIVLPVDDFSRFRHFDLYGYNSNLFFSSKLRSTHVTYNNWITPSDNERSTRLTHALPAKFLHLTPHRINAHLLRRFDLAYSYNFARWSLFSNFYNSVLSERLYSFYVNKPLLYEAKLTAFGRYNLIAKSQPLLSFRRRIRFYKSTEFLKFSRPQNRIWFFGERNRFFFDINLMWFTHHFKESSLLDAHNISLPTVSLQNFLVAEYMRTRELFFFGDLFQDDSALYAIYRFLFYCWSLVISFISVFYQTLNWNTYLRLDRTYSGCDKIYSSLLFGLPVLPNIFIEPNSNLVDFVGYAEGPARDVEASLNNFSSLRNVSSRLYTDCERFLLYSGNYPRNFILLSSLPVLADTICTSLLPPQLTMPSLTTVELFTLFDFERSSVAPMFYLFDLWFESLLPRKSNESTAFFDTFLIWQARHNFFKKLGHDSFHDYATSSFSSFTLEKELFCFLEEKYGIQLQDYGVDFSPYVNIIKCWNTLCIKDENYKNFGLTFQFPAEGLVGASLLLHEDAILIKQLSLSDDSSYLSYQQHMRGLFKNYCVDIVGKMFLRETSLLRRNELIYELCQHTLARAYATYLFRAAYLLQNAIFNQSSIRYQEPFLTQQSRLNFLIEPHQFELLTSLISDLETFKLWYSTLVGGWLGNLLTIPTKSLFLDAAVDRAPCKNIFDSFLEPRECGLDAFFPFSQDHTNLSLYLLRDRTHTYYPAGYLFDLSSPNLLITLGDKGFIDCRPRFDKTVGSSLRPLKLSFYDKEHALNSYSYVVPESSIDYRRLKPISL